MALITVEEAADHLRLDLIDDGGSPPVITDDRLADLQAKIDEAQAKILNYIEMAEADLSASGVDEQWIFIVRAAVKLYLTSLYDDRDGTGQGDYLAENGAIARLLRGIRYPAIA